MLRFIGHYDSVIDRINLRLLTRLLQASKYCLNMVYA